MQLQVSKDIILYEEQKQHLQDFFEYAKRSLSENTLKSYDKSWRRFSKWCEENRYLAFNPPSGSFELLIGLFISSMAKSRQLKPASIKSHITGIHHHYLEKGVIVNTSHLAIKSAMCGIKRELGSRSKQKSPLTVEHIKILIDSIHGDSAIDTRDRALILTGFSGAFRRAELAGIKYEDLNFCLDGVSIELAFSKTDQLGEGRIVDIPNCPEKKYCAVTALKEWLMSFDISTGPVFRSIAKSGEISDKSIDGAAVTAILKKRCAIFGDTDQIAGTSLRSGHVTSGLRKGISEFIIMRQTGHKSFNGLKIYERLGREFKANSAYKIWE